MWAPGRASTIDLVDFCWADWLAGWLVCYLHILAWMGVCFLNFCLRGLCFMLCPAADGLFCCRILNAFTKRQVYKPMRLSFAQRDVRGF